MIAYHEAGHALVGHVLPDGDTVHKVSIVVPRPRARPTWFLPEDRYTHSRARSCGRRWRSALGGRTAEELVFGEITTGAANDIEKCTEIARAMVTAVRHERRARPAQVRPGAGRGLPRPRPVAPARLLRRRRRADRQRGQHADRARARRGASPSSSPIGPRSTASPTRWSSTRRSTTPSWPSSSRTWSSGEARADA